MLSNLLLPGWIIQYHQGYPDSSTSSPYHLLLAIYTVFRIFAPTGINPYQFRKTFHTHFYIPDTKDPLKSISRNKTLKLWRWPLHLQATLGLSPPSSLLCPHLYKFLKNHCVQYGLANAIAHTGDHKTTLRSCFFRSIFTMAPDTKLGVLRLV